MKHPEELAQSAHLDNLGLNVVLLVHAAGLQGAAGGHLRRIAGELSRSQQPLKTSSSCHERGAAPEVANPP